MKNKQEQPSQPPAKRTKVEKWYVQPGEKIYYCYAETQGDITALCEWLWKDKVEQHLAKKELVLRICKIECGIGFTFGFWFASNLDLETLQKYFEEFDDLPAKDKPIGVEIHKMIESLQLNELSPVH